MILAEKIREAANKFVDENFTKPEAADLYVIENAMRIGINIYLEHEIEECRKESCPARQ